MQTKKWRLHYNEVGTGQPVVMLHGSGPGATGWSNFKTTLAGLSSEYRAIAVDMPGWGKSDAAPPDDRDHVEALRLLLDELGLDRVAVIGNSMGGATALRFAVEHPERLSHLIPMGAPGPGPNIFAGGDPRGSEGMRVLLAAYRDPSPANFKELVSVMAYDPKFASDALAQERSESALANPQHLKDFLDAIAQGTPAGPGSAAVNAQQRLSEIQTPTLVVHGRNDRTLPYENALRLMAHIPNSRLLLLNQCGHWAQLEHADEFNRAVASFLAHA
ncbi:alpha/beta hydrolase [Jatrophihabitans sp.]|uniref:alpha/beta fold hydrolase n=1 Tax=Jatrophihabitans sp. TaxID=1932789 RepID=UPI0030C68531